MNNREEKEEVQATKEMENVDNVENIAEEILVLEEDIRSSEELLVGENSMEAEEIKKEKGFGARLLAAILDQVFCVGISIILLFIISAGVHMAGYRFVLIGNYNMFIILYIIVNILYELIMTASKLKNTFGKSLLKL